MNIDEEKAICHELIDSEQDEAYVKKICTLLVLHQQNKTEQN